MTNLLGSLERIAVARWIKSSKDLREDPRVLLMAKTLRASLVTCDILLRHAAVSFVVGCLHVLWAYADTHISEDDTLALGADDIDELVGLRGFCNLLPPDWMQVLDADHVKLPDFTVHNVTESTRRAQDAERQRRYRASRASHALGHDDSHMRQRDGSHANVARLEERREESITVAARPTRKDEPPELEEIKREYPKRAGSNPWPRALKAINARLAEGSTWIDLTAGTQRYNKFIRETGKERTEFVLQAATFFGPDKHFANAWEPPAQLATPAAKGRWQ